MKTSANPMQHVRDRACGFSRLAKVLQKQDRRTEAGRAYQAKRRAQLHLVCALGEPFRVASDDKSLLLVGSQPSSHMVRSTEYLFPRYEFQLEQLNLAMQQVIQTLADQKRPSSADIGDAFDCCDLLGKAFDTRIIRIHLGSVVAYVQNGETGPALFEARCAGHLAARLYRDSQQIELSCDRKQRIASAIDGVERELKCPASVPALIRLFESIDATPYSTRDVYPCLKAVQQVSVFSRQKSDPAAARVLLHRLRDELLSPAALPAAVSRIRVRPLPKLRPVRPAPRRRTAANRVLARVIVRHDGDSAPPAIASFRLNRILSIIGGCGGTAIYPRVVADASGRGRVVVIYAAELEHHELISERLLAEFRTPEVRVMDHRHPMFVAIRVPHDVRIHSQVVDQIVGMGCTVVQTMHGLVPHTSGKGLQQSLCFLASRPADVLPAHVAREIQPIVARHNGQLAVENDLNSVFDPRRRSSQIRVRPQVLLSDNPAWGNDCSLARSVAVSDGRPGLMSDLSNYLLDRGGRIIAPVSYTRDDQNGAVEILYEASAQSLSRIAGESNRPAMFSRLETQRLGDCRRIVGISMEARSFREVARAMAGCFAAHGLQLLETMPSACPTAAGIGLSLSAIAVSQRAISTRRLRKELTAALARKAMVVVTHPTTRAFGVCG